MEDVTGFEARETHAAWWQAGFTQGADVEYRDLILPLAVDLLAERMTGPVRVLDIGCGEGQLSRLLASTGAAAVVGFDPARAQAEEAVRRGGGPAYARAAAGAMPFAAGAFDAAVACLVFEHITDVDAAVAEVARVLRPGGRFVFLLNHPFIQTPGSGWIDDHLLDPPETYWRIGPYLDESLEMEQVDHGVFLPFVHRPLSRYVNALAAAGLQLCRMVEPEPPVGFLDASQAAGVVGRIPRLLVLVCERQGVDRYRERP